MEYFTILKVSTGEICDISTFEVNPAPTKKRRLNSKCENMYLLPDGTIKKDEDSIKFCQRLWKHGAYAPGTGCMYKKTMAEFNILKL
jgi:hypothetical protein